LTTIRGLAEKSKDDYVILAVLKPNPMDYYYKEFSYFNWLKLPSISVLMIIGIY